MEVGIINYGLGNVRSVANALQLLNVSYRLISKPSDLEYVDKIILPGVGAFGAAINKLKSQGFVEALNEHVIQKEKYFLGICIGMQLLAEKSFEFGEHQGLGFIPGNVKPLSESVNLPLPHIQWAPVSFKSSLDAFMELQDKYFYFVHSYHFIPNNKEHILCTANYEYDFVAGVHFRNILGFQFHPEKSQSCGLKLMELFCNL